MIIYCFDNDKSTETLIKNSVNAIGISDCTFFFNEKMSNINYESGSEVLAFIDTRIHGRKQNSFSLAGILRDKLKDCHIIFMSSFPEDMVHCFKNLIRPSGFLLKPIAPAEIAGIISSVDGLNRRNNRIQSVTISTHDYKRSIEISKLLYFSTNNKKVFCRLINGEKIEFYGTISNLEKTYSEDFVRCHSGFLVNRKYIKALFKGELELSECEEKIPVSRKYKQQIEDEVKKIEIW